MNISEFHLLFGRICNYKINFICNLIHVCQNKAWLEKVYLPWQKNPDESRVQLRWLFLGLNQPPIFTVLVHWLVYLSMILGSGSPLILEMRRTSWCLFADGVTGFYTFCLQFHIFSIVHAQMGVPSIFPVAGQCPVCCSLVLVFWSIYFLNSFGYIHANKTISQAISGSGFGMAVKHISMQW